MKNILFWFRNDLRLHDNEALYKAAKLGKILPVYVIDIRQFELTNLGFKRTEKFRTQFLLESLSNLKQNLQKLGSDLLIKVGIPEDELFEIVKKYDIDKVVTSKEATQEETSVETLFSQKLKTRNVDIDLYWANTLIHVRDLPFQIHYLPDVFTDFRKKVENFWKVRPCFPIPELKSFDFISNEVPSLSDLGYDNFEKSPKDDNNFVGGEDFGLQRLKDFLWESKSIENYKTTRNELSGKDSSSKLSPWLSLGCISPRKIYEELQNFEKEVAKNESTHWYIIELLWRDYYHFISLKFGIRLFKRSGIKHDFTKKWNKNLAYFEAWKNGKTGIPVVDACMRKLKETGYISNRARHIVASYYTKDMENEWWWGAMYFESQLIDYEVCSNWGNWNYIAGIGTDPKSERYINPIIQMQKYDPNAEYIKIWLPELRNISVVNIMEMNFNKNNFDINNDYPLSPIVKTRK